jgi:hypothetical protein
VSTLLPRLEGASLGSLIGSFSRDLDKEFTDEPTSDEWTLDRTADVSSFELIFRREFVLMDLSFEVLIRFICGEG